MEVKCDGNIFITIPVLVFMAALMNDHKLGDLKQHIFSILQFCRLQDQDLLD